MSSRFKPTHLIDFNTSIENFEEKKASDLKEKLFDHDLGKKEHFKDLEIADVDQNLLVSEATVTVS